MILPPKFKQIYLFSVVAILSLIGVYALQTLHAPTADAKLEEFDQCFAPANTTDAIFQVGLFVSNPDFQTNTSLTVHGQIKNGWQYTYFSGNSPAEITSLAVAPGTITGTITGSTGQIIESVVDMPTAGKYTVLAYGSGGTSGLQPIQYGTFADDPAPISAGKGKVRVIHASGFHENLNNLLLDFRFNEGEVMVVDNLAFGSQAYFEVEPGEIKIEGVDQTGDFTLFDIKPFDVAEGELVTLILYGDSAESMDVYPLSNCQSLYKINQLVSPPEFPRFEGFLHFINLSPLSSQIDGTKLNLSLDGAVQFADVEYGTSTGTTQVEAKYYTAQVKSNESNIVLSTIGFELEKDRSYTLIATGGGAENVEHKLTLIENDLSVPNGNNGALRFGNFLTDLSPNNGLTLVDEMAQSITFSGVDVGQLGEPDYQQISAGLHDYDVHIGPQSIIDPEPFNVASGSRVSLFAAGNGVEQPYQLFKTVDGSAGEMLDLEVGRLYVAHLAPFAPTAEETAVTLKIDGDIVDSFAQYGDSTGYINLRAGKRTIEVEKDGTVLVSREIDLVKNKDYTVIFSGSQNQLTLSEPIQTNFEQTENATVQFGQMTRDFHLVTFSDLVAPLETNVVFGQIGQNQVAVPAGDLNLSVTDSLSGDELINPAPIKLSAGDSAIFVAAKNKQFDGHAVYAIVNGQSGAFLEIEQERSHVYVANLLALNSELTDPTITIQFNGEPVGNAMRFGESSPGLLELPVGTGTLELFVSNRVDAVLSMEIATEKDAVYWLFAHGLSTDPKIEFRQQLPTAKLGTFKILAGNLVPEPAGFFRSVSIYQNETQVSENLSSGEMMSEYETSITSTSTFEVKSSDGSNVLLETPELNFADNSSVILLIGGDGGINQPYGLFAIVNNEQMELLPSVEGGTSSEPLINISQFVSSSSDKVRIRLNDQLLDGTLAFGDMEFSASGILGSNNIEVLDAETMEVLAEHETDFLNQSDVYLAFVGDDVDGGGIAGYGLVVPAEDEAGKSGITYLNLAVTAENGSANSSTLHFENRRPNDANVTFEAIEFGMYESKSVDAGTYDPILTSADEKEVFANPSVLTFGMGDQVAVVSAGNGSNIPISLYQFQLIDGKVQAIKVANEASIIDYSDILFLPVVIK